MVVSRCSIKVLAGAHRVSGCQRLATQILMNFSATAPGVAPVGPTFDRSCNVQKITWSYAVSGEAVNEVGPRCIDKLICQFDLLVNSHKTVCMLDVAKIIVN